MWNGGIQSREIKCVDAVTNVLRSRTKVLNKSFGVCWYPIQLGKIIFLIFSGTPKRRQNGLAIINYGFYFWIA
jgi:hypothetical protein